MTEEHSKSWQARYLEERFTPEGRQFIAQLPADVIQLAYKAVSTMASYDNIIGPPDDDEEWFDWMADLRAVMREHVPALKRVSDDDLDLAFAGVIGRITDKPGM